MPDQTQNETQQPLENSEEALEQTSSSHLMGKLKVVALVAAVVLVECGVAYMLIPSTVADAQSSEAAIRAAEMGLAGNEEEKADEEGRGMTEEEAGRFDTHLAESLRLEQESNRTEQLEATEARLQAPQDRQVPRSLRPADLEF